MLLLVALSLRVGVGDAAATPAIFAGFVLEVAVTLTFTFFLVGILAM